MIYLDLPDLHPNQSQFITKTVPYSALRINKMMRATVSNMWGSTPKNPRPNAVKPSNVWRRGRDKKDWIAKTLINKINPSIKLDCVFQYVET